MENYTKADLDTIAILTPAEQTKMRRRLLINTVLIMVILGSIVGISAWNHYRFVLTGQTVQATILDITKHRSAGRHSRTHYWYQLEAVVNGKTVVDEYDVGSTSFYDEGDTIAVYATSDETPELAVTAREGTDLPLIVGGLLFGIGIQMALRRKLRGIATGKMRIGNLSKAMRQRKLAEIEETRVKNVSPESIADNTTPDGKPMYTIGGSSATSTVPIEGNDGREYLP